MREGAGGVGCGLPGGPLTDFRRGRRNLPLPLERVKSRRRLQRSECLARWGPEDSLALTLSHGRGKRRRAQRGGLLLPWRGCWGRQPPSSQPSPSREKEEERPSQRWDAQGALVVWGVGCAEDPSPQCLPRGNLCETPGLIARKTPHRFRPGTAEPASPPGEGEEPAPPPMILLPSAVGARRTSHRFPPRTAEFASLLGAGAERRPL